jgi:pimeloyl-ACP methyl ester carboxylesterase
MPQVTANGALFEVETIGQRSNPALLLIMGLGMQLASWPDEFCIALADAGYFVIRFDNRDSGLSVKTTSRVNMLSATLRYLLHLRVPAAYKLDDMAADSIGILDALGIEAAHVLGASMGGMIAQQIAAKYPNRVLSLISIMSSSGARNLPRPTPAASRVLLSRPPRRANFAKVVDHYVHLFDVIGSPGFRMPEAELRPRLEKVLQRAYYPGGAARQLLAIVASGDRSHDLAKIRAPTLVIHGADDPLVRVAAGKDTAAKIQNAKLLVVPGMGHDLAAGLIPILTKAITKHLGNVHQHAAH